MEVSELRLNNITIQSKVPQKLMLITEKKTLKLQGLILKKLVCCTSCFERVIILSVKYSLNVFKVTAKIFQNLTIIITMTIYSTLPFSKRAYSFIIKVCTLCDIDME